MPFYYVKGASWLANEQGNYDREVLIQLTRVETKVDMIGNVKEIALEAQQSAKSAHHRLDKVEKVHFWAGTTIIGGVIVGAISLLFHFAK